MGTEREIAGTIRVEDGEAEGDFIVLCDHASNRVPPGFGDTGLSPDDMARHIAWDPGALEVARRLARRLDAALAYPDATRLLIDCNRPPDAPASILAVSETTEIPGNRDLPPALRAWRRMMIYDAYHAVIEALIAARAGRPLALVTVHSFNPVYCGDTRPWHVGLVYDADRRLADPLRAALDAEPGLLVGLNEPYAPADGVYHTIERHAGPRDLPAVMIEIRNDLIAGEAAQEAWAERLAGPLEEGLRSALAATFPQEAGHP